ncbi:MAG: ribosome maturation factor RimP [Clostridia bacterium]|nr:ribosome maturation factor RimP [Clostridia bacterium]
MEKVREILTPYLEKNDMYIWNMEMKKEGKDLVLRVYADRNEGYISTDDCEVLSNFLSDELDRLDPIEGEYMLEISSPGMDRELVTPEHFERYMGEMVDVSLKDFLKEGYLKGQNMVEGKLLSASDGEVSVSVLVDKKSANRKPGAKIGKNSLEEITFSFKRDDIKCVRLAVIF